MLYTTLVRRMVVRPWRASAIVQALRWPASRHRPKRLSGQRGEIYGSEMFVFIHARLVGEN